VGPAATLYLSRRAVPIKQDLSMSLAATTPAAAVARPATGQRGVRAWLFLLAGLVFAMVVVGGATRLTGSGLSITEWRPVTGAVPPLNEQAWQAEFSKYRQSPQFEIANNDMDLAGFKEIYWWEWSHRQLGRSIGLVFALGFVLFWWTGALRGRTARTVLVLGALGGLQGAIGWFMVASGLQPGMTAVAPVKLMLHLVTASLIFAGLVWVAMGLARGRSVEPVPAGVRHEAVLLLGLVGLQIALGALVAGSRAGFAYNTWPLMDGRLIPPADILFVVKPWIENLVDNVALVQLNHRLAGYVVVAAALWHAWSTRRLAAGSSASRRAVVIAGLAVAQMGIGVATLLLAVPLALGLLHQGVAMMLLAMAVVHARLSATARPAPVLAQR
jgi:cytochrome c oxidase assembly protein subunit 15